MASRPAILTNNTARLGYAEIDRQSISGNSIGFWSREMIRKAHSSREKMMENWRASRRKSRRLRSPSSTRIGHCGRLVKEEVHSKPSLSFPTVWPGFRLLRNYCAIWGAPLGCIMQEWAAIRSLGCGSWEMSMDGLITESSNWRQLGG